MAIKIAINGFGRIGRQITRLLSTGFSAGLELRAVNALESIDIAAHLLRHDSNHGPFEGSVSINGPNLVINGQEVSYLTHSNPRHLPWQQLGVDLVIEASGQWTDRKSASLHLQAGAQKVLITAAAQAPDVTLCMGVNHTAYQPDRHQIISGSSCTANCLAPAAKLINDRFGIRSSFATFLHSYTSSQHLLDLPGPDLRRMRAAGCNIMPTSTSAVEQIPELIPELIGKFDAIAIRVPTPQVHLAYFTALLHRPTTGDEILAVFHEAAATLAEILAVSASPLVSIDFKGHAPSCVLDAGTIKVMDDMIQLMIWHDNESSYCKRMLDLVRYMAMFHP